MSQLEEQQNQEMTMADMEILHQNTVNIPMQERTVTMRQQTPTNGSDEEPDGQNIGPMYKK